MDLGVEAQYHNARPIGAEAVKYNMKRVIDLNAYDFLCVVVVSGVLMVSGDRQTTWR
jgi:hypothetical protein